MFQQKLSSTLMKWVGRCVVYNFKHLSWRTAVTLPQALVASISLPFLVLACEFVEMPVWPD